MKLKERPKAKEAEERRIRAMLGLKRRSIIKSLAKVLRKRLGNPNHHVRPSKRSVTCLFLLFFLLSFFFYPFSSNLDPSNTII